MSRTLIDLDDAALAMAMAHYGTTVKREAVNRALRDVAEQRIKETRDLEDWLAQVGARLSKTDLEAAWQ